MFKVAIIMSVYKQDSLDAFRESVYSILNQDYENLTLFIYKDGVLHDQVSEFIDTILTKEPRVKVFGSSYNEGLAASLNFLIETVIAEPEYKFLARMDSDDISLPHRITKQVDFLSRNENVHVCGTSCKEFGADFSLNEKHLPINHSQLIDFSIIRCPFIHPSVMFRREIFDSGYRYPCNTGLTEDMALWFNLLRGGYIFHNINEILLEYRLNNNTINRRRGLSKAVSEFKIRFNFMISMRRFTVFNFILILSRLFFHLLPLPIMRFLYKIIR